MTSINYNTHISVKQSNKRLNCHTRTSKFGCCLASHKNYIQAWEIIFSLNNKSFKHSTIWFKKSWLLSSNQTWTDLISGVAPTRGIDDKQSTLSRYWTMDRSLQRKLGKTNYQHIKRLCRDRGQLFEDTDFPPSNKAIYSHRKPALHPIVWMRPHVSQF